VTPDQVDRLEALVLDLGTADQGPVQRSGDPRDARVVLPSLTPAGKAAALPALSRLADALRRPNNLVEVTR
jgi:hypothetical protein